jgi:hypothetical protein
MRDMVRRFCIILIDDHQILIRVYELASSSFTLLYYKYYQLPHSSSDEVQGETTTLLIADFFASPYSDHLVDWKIVGRNIQNSLLVEITSLLGSKIEYITPEREQELLCKGVLTEMLLYETQ